MENSHTICIMEALLLAASTPLSAHEFSELLDIDATVAAELLADLSATYAEKKRGFDLREVPGGWQFFTREDYSEYIERLLQSQDRRRLSDAALETLCIVAYKQPVTREEIRSIRGVSSDGVLASLIEKNLVRGIGRSASANGALVYGTTNAFLAHFGLRSLKDLPPIEQFAATQSDKEAIAQRLHTSVQEELEQDITEKENSERA